MDSVMIGNQKTDQIVFTNKAKCMDCYRCVRICPVKAIKVEDSQAFVIDEKCIACGTCVKECPQHAKSYRRDLKTVKLLLDSGARVCVTLAPSFVSNFKSWEAKRIPSFLRSQGVSYIAETSCGAYYTAKEFSKEVETRKKIISAACPAIVNYIEKYDPENIKYLSNTPSPVILHALHLKEQFGEDTKVIFIGPCVAKKSEAEREEYKDLISAVLTFEELQEWIDKECVNLKQFEESFFDELPAGLSRLFPLEGGLIKTAFEKTTSHSKLLFNSCHFPLTGFSALTNSLDFIEKTKTIIIDPLFCEYGCIDGPASGSSENPLFKKKKLLEYHNLAQTSEAIKNYHKEKKSEYKSKLSQSYFTEEEIKHILKATGKHREDDYLNCGACGYDTCRDKAIAVLEGKAEITMCIPYMRRNAENRADNIFELSPNGIVILDDKLNIIKLNDSFKKMFLCSDSALKKNISYFFDPQPFEKILSGEILEFDETQKYSDYGIECQLKISYMEKENQVLCIFVNVTNARKNKKQLDNMKLNTIMQAQELLDHQISMAQTLAKFLGESTAKGEQLLKNLTEIKSAN